MPLPPSLIPCPVCGAAVPAFGSWPSAHLHWHDDTGTLNGWTLNDSSAAMERAAATAATAMTAGDDAPTTRMPPVGATTRRRPPVPPPVRELTGAELLHELGRMLERGEFDDEPGTES